MNNTQNKTLIVIGGPTASGKTGLAIRLAQAWNTEIISGDSRQIYKGMAIGTAQPTQQELSQAKHHFIHFLEPDQLFSAGDFEQAALKLLESLFQKHDKVICVGGSGLYLKALYQGIDNLPKVDAGMRNQLNKELEKNGLPFLLKELQEKDPEYYSLVDKHNPQRVIRALEIIRQTGNPFSSFHTGQPTSRNFKTIKIAPNWDREILYKRINTRVLDMVDAGWLNEVKQLKPYWNCNALKTVGYNQLIEHLQGKISLQEAIELIQRDTRRYAKRQITWFKKEGFEWINAESIQPEEIVSR